MNLLNIFCILFYTSSNLLKKNVRKIHLNGKSKKFDIKNETKYVPKSENQLEYIKSLNNNHINLLFCLGPAGSGKTLFENGIIT